MRTQSLSQAQSSTGTGSSAGWAGAAGGDDDELDVPEAEDDLEQRMYGAMLESGLQQEQAKHGAPCPPPLPVAAAPGHA